MSCQVSVLYFARSAELAGLRCETLRVPRQVTSLQLWEEIVRVHPSVVPITEASVIIAVSSPHRAESLEAVTYCINTLKASVPIWKKEPSPTGAVQPVTDGWPCGSRGRRGPCREEPTQEVAAERRLCGRRRPARPAAGSAGKHGTSLPMSLRKPPLSHSGMKL
ncbi:uncharacterized protein MOCS2 isoform 8-T12 [Alca torda]